MAEIAAAPLRKTALNAAHRAARAKMVDFGGWDMPVEYVGLIAEHMAVRTAVGLFDVSHMGDIQLRGPGSLAAVNQLCMNDASKLQVGQAHYSAMLYPNGTFVDDVIVHKLSDNDYLIVINAGTREKDIQWVRQTVGHMPSVHINDFSDHYTQLAIQGPRAAETLQKLTPVDLSTIRNYWFTWGTLALADGSKLYNVMIARTGYTGEDGFEIYIPSDEPTSGKVWDEVLAAGAEFGIVPCGLGARNTLRLESAMALYGHEISDTINVLEANLGRYAKLDKASFVGREALLDVQASGGPKRKLVGLEMLERGIARDGYPVLASSGEVIGEVTSGSPAPFLKKNIGLAYVPVQYAGVDEEVAVQIRGQQVKAKVVALPFYKRPKKPPKLRIYTERGDGMAYPAEYRYTKQHEWIEVSGTTGTVGITDYAQSTLGDIVFVELPKVGQEVKAGSTFGSVESVKAVSDLYAPLTGTVTEINEGLGSAPETINTDANTTWIMKVDLADPTAIDGLLSAADYEAFIAEETGH